MYARDTGSAGKDFPVYGGRMPALPVVNVHIAMLPVQVLTPLSHSVSAFCDNVSLSVSE